jgi:hypothetical protein
MKNRPRRTATACEPAGNAPAVPRMVERPLASGMVLRMRSGLKAVLPRGRDEVVNDFTTVCANGAPLLPRMLPAIVIAYCDAARSGSPGSNVTTLPTAETLPLIAAPAVRFMTVMPPAAEAGSMATSNSARTRNAASTGTSPPSGETLRSCGGCATSGSTPNGTNAPAFGEVDACAVAPSPAGSERATSENGGAGSAGTGSAKRPPASVMLVTPSGGDDTRASRMAGPSMPARTWPYAKATGDSATRMR